MKKTVFADLFCSSIEPVSRTKYIEQLTIQVGRWTNLEIDKRTKAGRENRRQLMGMMKKMTDTDLLFFAKLGKLIYQQGLWEGRTKTKDQMLENMSRLMSGELKGTACH